MLINEHVQDERYLRSCGSRCTVNCSFTTAELIDSAIGNEHGSGTQGGEQMKHFLKVAFSVLALAVLLTLASTAANAQDPSAAPAADNTKVNERDRSNAQ